MKSTNQESRNLRIEYVPLSTVEGWPGNPKLHSEDELAESMERFGFLDPVAVDERTGRLVEGHGRIDTLRAMRDEGLSPPGQIRTNESGEWLVPVVRGLEFKDEYEAQAYLLAHNRITERGGWDEKALHEMLVELQDEADAALEGTAFTADDVDRLASALLESATEGIEATPPGEFADIDTEKPLDYCCPKCGYEWDGNPR